MLIKLEQRLRVRPACPLWDSAQPYILLWAIAQYGSDKKFAMFRQALELLSGGDRELLSRGDEGLMDINSFPPAPQPPCTSAVVGVKMS